MFFATDASKMFVEFTRVKRKVVSLCVCPRFAHVCFDLTEPTLSFGRAGVECYCQHESGAGVIQLQFLINEVWIFFLMLMYCSGQI